MGNKCPKGKKKRNNVLDVTDNHVSSSLKQKEPEEKQFRYRWGKSFRNRTTKFKR